jgi:ABC-type nitrate/sulfonate/bicarbonate transport system permease component
MESKCEEGPEVMNAAVQESGPGFLGKYSRGATETAYRVLVLILFILIWELFFRWARSSYVPSPWGVARAVYDLVLHGDFEGYSLWQNMWASVLRILVGFGLSLITGVILGLFMGLFPFFYDTTKVIIEPIRFIPPLAWIPVAIVLLKGFSRYVFIIWLGAFFPIFISVLSSVPKVDPILKDVIRVYGGNRWDIIRKNILPSVTPEIFAGAKISLGVSWMCIVAAEMIGGENVGLGRLILKYADKLMTNEIVVGMLFIGVIGFLSNEAMLRLERHLFKWRGEQSL